MFAILLKYVILLMCCMIIVLDAVKFRCDYTYYSTGWYKYNEIPMTWSDARLHCHLEGTILASPTTIAIKNTMKNAIGKDDIFTGIHATFSKGHYYSIDGIPLHDIPHTWADSEPDNKNNAEQCLALNSDGKMSDVSCDQPLPFICYRENTSKDVTVCGTPDPDYHFDASTNKCYKFHTTPRQFKRAHFACSAEGGHLAIINSEEESRIIRDMYALHPGNTLLGNFIKDIAFVGFHNWGESADWTTIHGQSLQDAGFTKFSGGQPDNATAGEYCGSVFRSGLLNDVWCEKHLTFFCEKKPEYPPVCDNSFTED